VTEIVFRMLISGR